MRILRTRPDPDLAVLIIGDSTGWTDRCMHLIRPDISPLHRLGGAGNCFAHVALVDERTRPRGIGAQRCLEVSKIGQSGRRLPTYLELRRRPDGIFLALGHHADEVADTDDRNEAWNIVH